MERTKIYAEKDGERLEFDVILTFKNEENNKDYILYTDNGYDKNGKLKIYAAVYNPDTLEFIEVPQTKDEWDQIYKVLDKVILDK